jgi:probable ribonuclease FAU-1
MSGPRVRVRGIYATAITAVLAQRGFVIVDPTPIISSRLGLPQQPGPEEVAIWDRRDRQGVVVEGWRDGVEAVVAAVREAVPFALAMPSELGTGEGVLARALGPLRARYLLEFPLPAKEELDRIRASVVPTVPGHHYFKVMDPGRVDQMEAEATPGGMEAVRQALLGELVFPFFRPGATVRVYHVKAGEEGFEFKGTVRALEPGRLLVLARRFRGGGTYDGLGQPKQEGDTGMVELWEGRWFSRRIYMRQDGTILGEIYNVNTPPELYQGTVRYLDLEVDVVRFPDGRVEVQDEEVLADKERRGLLPPALVQRARACAHELAMALRALE